MALHRHAPHPRRRLVVGAMTALAVVGLVAAVLALRPDTGSAVRGAGESAALPVVTPSTVPVQPAVAPPPTTTRPTTTRTTTTTSTASRTTPARTTPRRAAAAGPVGRILALVNAARADAGCRAVTSDTALDRAAAGYAALMARSGTFSHTGPDGSSFADRIRAAGYPDPAGENIAHGQSSADEVMTAWMNSAGHRRNILDCSFRTLGVGHATDGDYWVQDFGR